jgi:hypothetical protein
VNHQVVDGAGIIQEDALVNLGNALFAQADNLLAVRAS